MLYKCRTNLPVERRRNGTVATFCRWSKPTTALTPETKGKSEGARGVLRLPALHMKHTFLHLIPMKSHRKMLLQRQRSVWGGGGGRRKWCGTAKGPLQRIPHYTLVTALEYYLCENTPSPSGEKVEERKRESLISALCGCSLDSPASVNLSAGAASTGSRTKRAGGFEPLRLSHILYDFLLLERRGTGPALSPSVKPTRFHSGGFICSNCRATRV